MTEYNLAFVIEKYFEFGGLQRDMRRIASACAKAGHNVTVFTGNWQGPADNSLNIQLVNFSACSNHRKMKNIQRFVQSLRRSRGFDCIVGFNRVGTLDVYFAGDTCLKAKLHRAGKSWLALLPRYRTYLALEKAVFGPSTATDIMMISQPELENFTRLYNTPAERIHLLPPGIDRRLAANPFSDDEKKTFRADLDIAADDLMLLTVGSGFRTKGVDRAIAALAALPTSIKEKFKYVIVGRGKQKAFRKIAARAALADNVVFTGGRNDIACFYHAADLLIHPARTENTGTVILEAMTAGLPVLVTANCGYAHYVADANAGILCPEPFEQQKLNRILQDLLTKAPHLAEYRANALNYCQNADIYQMTEKAVELILNRAEKNRVNK